LAGRRHIGLLGAALVALGLAGGAVPAAAMQFSQVGNDADLAQINGWGEIIQGDGDRLKTALEAAGASRSIALVLDSPGGSVVEGERMAHMIRDNDIAVVIPNNGKCVSACFLLLAAALRRFAGPDALVGVHSASESGEETATSMAVTTAMARIAADFDVPPAILGKMVRTVPGRVEWLTHDDLRAMGVRILGEAAPATPSPAPPPQPQPQRQAVIAPPPQPMPQPAPQPAPQVAPRPPVYAPAPSTFVAPTFVPPTVAPPAFIAPTPPMTSVAEFRGAYFCTGPTSITLRLSEAGADGQRRALLSFTPGTGGQARFMLEGRLDLGGGVIELRPVAGSAQPGGTAMLGLSGRSNDGGRTFTGHVTTSTTCSVFTLRRAG
jgi:hypothetical protein